MTYLLQNKVFLDLEKANALAVENRLFGRSDYQFRPASVHDPVFHGLLKRFPYYGPVVVSVFKEKIAFLMHSMNDDIVSKMYFFFGPDAYEPLSVAIWATIAADARGSILDIGAYTGLFTLVAREVNKRVTCIAFEPVSITRARLLQNLALNRTRPSILIEPFAISDVKEMVQIKTAHNLPHLDAGASLAVKAHRKITSGEIVQTITLDQYFSDQPELQISLVKLDVELHEAQVLAGAKNTIARTKPAMLLEVSISRTFAKLREFFTEQGYELFLINDRLCELVPVVSEFTTTSWRAADVFNIIGVHGERQRRLVLAAHRRFHNLYPDLKASLASSNAHRAPDVVAP